MKLPWQVRYMLSSSFSLIPLASMNKIQRDEPARVSPLTAQAPVNGYLHVRRYVLYEELKQITC
jgi:hypothetical protein